MTNPELERLSQRLAEDEGCTIYWTKANAFLAFGDGEALLVGRLVGEGEWAAHVLMARERIVDSVNSGGEAVDAVEEWLYDTGGL